MRNGAFLTATIVAAGEPEPDADRASVPWWSFTKTALAAAALQLVARGCLDLDAEISSRRPVTLRQLLQHRAGLPDYGALASYQEAVQRGETPWEIGELLERVAADHLEFRPGHGWRYSNVGYLFVRRLIEEAVGSDLGSALRHLVFDRLGLQSVRMANTLEDLAATAWGNRAAYHPGWVYHGLLIGTPGDAVRFLHGLMSGDVLPRELLAEMTKPHLIGEAPLPGRPWETTSYGLGLMIGRMAHAGFAIGHSGGGPGSVSAVYHFGDRPMPCTIAAFAAGEDEGATEYEAARLLPEQSPQ
jgi:CubicO group peptidase (beta-lactamase class C family)